MVNGATGEGDGIDSNGWLVIDGGIITSSACGFSGDAGIDADKGVYIRGGQVIAGGNMLDHVQGEQTHLVLTFSQRQKGGSTYTLKNESGSTVLTCATANDFQYLILSSPVIEEGDYTLWHGQTQLHATKAGGQMSGGMFGPGMGKPDGERPEPPEGEMPQRPEGEIPTRPQGQRPEWPEGEMPEPPEGEVPSFPQGGQRPGGDMFYPGMGENGNGETTEILTVTKGANQFQITA